MSKHDDFDLDEAMRRAWSRFQSDLADHIVNMGDDDILIVDAESSLDEDAEGAAPYVQFCGWGEGLVRAEVSSNHYLDARVALDDDAEVALVEAGWQAPTLAPDEYADTGSTNFYRDAGRREGDRLAAMAVAALRDVFGVPHPAFLGWPGAQVTDDTDGQSDVGADDADDADDPWRDEPLAVLPESADHLRKLVEAALAVPGGVAIEYDEDGDIPLPTGSATLYVRVHETAPVVEVFAVVACHVQDKRRSRLELGVLNRDNRLVKFVLLEDFVVATVHVPAMPFAPWHLRTVVGLMAKTVDEVAGDLVTRVGGRRPGEPEAEVEADEELEYDELQADMAEEQTLPSPLLTLKHLDPHGEGVDPELAASVCEFDRELVLSLLTQASEQEITWRKSGDRALSACDAEEAEVCFHEGRAWRATVETLRAALRVIVAEQYAESPARRRSSESEGRRRASRRSRGPRQETLIDDAPIRRQRTGQDILFDSNGDS